MNFIVQIPKIENSNTRGYNTKSPLLYFIYTQIIILSYEINLNLDYDLNLVQKCEYKGKLKGIGVKKER